jgi:carbonic anhydrase/SulP family sulfate permease
VDLAGAPDSAAQATGCQHLGPIVHEIQKSLEGLDASFQHLKAERRQAFIDAVARRNVVNAIDRLLAQSQTLANLVHAGTIAVIGAMYDVSTGSLEFQTESWSDPVDVGMLARR